MWAYSSKITVNNFVELHKYFHRVIKDIKDNTLVYHKTLTLLLLWTITSSIIVLKFATT